ncbi:RDD family protein [Brevundimonas subvibrioides]|uniref:RDD family protein n=1 Tax=Brevundimonas subvibrioides TaxID=74313 RepID=UPI0022B45E96|nr:RDD family protein [Brevundimonas subvibrioides]
MREFITPEGVDLRLNIADAGQRAAAFLLDAAIIVGVLIGLTVAAVLMGLGAAAAGGGGAGLELVAIVWLLGFFLLRNFYFVAFELSARAATPGKRIIGLRVASRDGGRLRAESVFARNAMRELEVFLPLSLLVGQSQGGGVESWMYLLGFIWAAAFALFPLFNRDRLRLGDIVGGTWVVRNPRRKLTRDMADEGGERLSRFAFTAAQLEAYGAKELHVLDDVLRVRNRRIMRSVAERIAARIGWNHTPFDDDYDFLSAYYAALRGRLEQRLLMGVRRRDKHDV